MGKKIRSVRKLQVQIMPVEDKYVDKFEDEGFSINDLIRQWIVLHGSERYPEEKLYAKAAKARAEIARAAVEDKIAARDMTNEQYATEVLRGKVVGDKVEFRDSHGQGVFYPLVSIKKFTRQDEEEIAIHNELLDQTYRYVGGGQPNWQEIFAGWETPGEGSAV